MTLRWATASTPAKRLFEAIVAKQFAEAGNKVIIVLHAPDWQKRECKALSMICQMARTKGEVCAILAGDLHHYSSYTSEKSRKPEMRLITSGGGGAFAHPTHDQKGRIEVRRRSPPPASVKKLARRGPQPHSTAQGRPG